MFLEHLCSEYDIELYFMGEENNLMIYKAIGDPFDIFAVGIGIGIEIGEQIMYDAVMKRNDN